jgi:uncharacterized protein (UPF0276 family)
LKEGIVYKKIKQLGVGLGYRAELANELAHNMGEIDFLEIIGDHCFDPTFLSQAKKLAAKLPIVCHFLGLSLATAEPLDDCYLQKVCEVASEVHPCWLSDHLAVTKVQGVDIGHLAPASFTDETVEVVTRKIIQVQERLGLPLLLENITYHFELPGATLTEGQLIKRIVETADCGILLDLNNVYVNSYNNEYDPVKFMLSLPLDRVMQIHIGGAVERDGVMIDSHAHPVADPVFEYLRFVCKNSSVGAILLERDSNFPAFDELARDMRLARAILAECMASKANGTGEPLEANRARERRAGDGSSE